jgi:hypothetical protein
MDLGRFVAQLVSEVLLEHFLLGLTMTRLLIVSYSTWDQLPSIVQSF